MVLLVPFDGSDLSEAALRRATEFSEFVGEDVIVLTVVPTDEEYAQERGWVEAGAAYDPDRLADEFETRVTEIAPGAEFRRERTDDIDDLRIDTTTDVVRRIRQVADEVDASILFVGSENAGRVSTPVTSVGNPISEDPRYDVHIVRHPD